MKYADDIYQTIRDKFLTLNQSITNFNIGSRIRSIFEAAALAIEQLWFRLDAIYQALFSQTAKGDDLDWRGLELGLTRFSAKKSTGVITFTGDSSTKIPIGTIVSTDTDIEPVIEFLTTEASTIPESGSVDIKIESHETGLNTNVEAGKINYLSSSIAGIESVANASAVSGGADIEDDETFRKRLVLRWYSLNGGGTEAYFRSVIMNIEHVAETKVVPCAYGPGTVKILVWSKNQEGSLIPASAELLSQIEEQMDDIRPLCIKTYLEVPTGIITDVFIYLKVKSGYVFTTISDLIDTAVTEYFDNLSVGSPVLISRLISEIMSIEGIDDIKIELPAANLNPASTEKVMLGNIVINPFPSPIRPETGVVW